MKKKCIVCKKEISKAKFNQKVCSNCSKEYYREQNRIRENKRYWNNHEVMRKRGNDSYHRNMGARRKKIREKLLKENPFKFCHICGKKIKVDTLIKLKNQKYCSDECYWKAHNSFIVKNYRQKLKNENRCVVCGTKLVNSDYGSKFKCLKCNLKDVKYMRVLMDVKEHRFEIINCVLCGEDITNRKSQSKYCDYCAEEISRLIGMKHIHTNYAISLLKSKLNGRKGEQLKGIAEEFLWKVTEEDLFRIYNKFYRKLKRKPLLKEIEKEFKDFAFGYNVRIRFGNWNNFTNYAEKNSIVSSSNSSTASSHSLGEHNKNLEVTKSLISLPNIK